MKTWSVYGRVVGSKYLGDFEAETKDEAIEIAMKAEGMVSLCYQCASECEDPEIEEFFADEVKE